jgi:hypothetical protein
MTGQLFGVSIYGKSHKFRIFKITPDLSVAYTVWRITVNTIFVVKQSTPTPTPTPSPLIVSPSPSPSPSSIPQTQQQATDSIASSLSQLSLQGNNSLRFIP